MMRTRSSILVVLAMHACLVATSAFADCDQPITKLTPKEKAYYNSHFPVLRAAIPKPPAGWQYSDEAKTKLAPDYKDYLPEFNCGPSNYYLDLGIDYERPMTQADSDKEMQAMQAKPDPAKQKKLDDLMAQADSDKEMQAMQAMQAKPDPAKQKKLDDLMAQEQALMQKTMDAAQKQDYKTVDALGKQGDTLNKQISAVQQDMNAGSRATVDAVQWDRKATVHISINDASGDATCYGNPKPLQVPGAIAYECGAPATYSSPGEALDPASGHVVVVYGKATVQQYEWTRQDAQGKQVTDHYVDIKCQLDDSHAMVVQNLVVDVAGDDLARAQSLYKQMNLAPLAALIKI